MLVKGKDYFVPLLRLMSELPDGQGRTGTILERFLDRYHNEIDDSHFELNQDRTAEKWRKTTEFARLELVRLGYLDDPEFGVWAITPKGREWVAAHPYDTHLKEAPLRPSSAAKQQRPVHSHRAVSPPSEAQPTISLAKLNNVRKFMPAEDFQRDFGELYGQLLAQDRARYITPIDRTKILNAVIEEIHRIQEYVRGQSEEKPSSEKLCDWIHECYLFGLHREIALLWSLVDKEQVNPWYYELTQRFARACKPTATG